MAATVAGALKAHLEGLALGVPVFRDGAPAEQPMPFLVVQDGIGYAAELHGDTADPDAHQGDTELVQVDLYQEARTADPAHAGRTLPGESRDLHLRVRRGLTTLARTSYGTPPVRIYGVTRVAGRRWPISDNVVRHTYTASIRRDT